MRKYLIEGAATLAIEVEVPDENAARGVWDIVRRQLLRTSALGDGFMIDDRALGVFPEASPDSVKDLGEARAKGGA